MAFDRSSAQPVGGGFDRASAVAGGGAKTKVTELVEEPTKLDYAHDAGTAAGRVVTETADFPHVMAGWGATGIDKAMTKFPQFFAESPMLLTAAVGAEDYLQRSKAPSGLLSPEVKEKVTERNIPIGQKPWWDRGVKFAETAAGALRHPTKLMTMIDDILAGIFAVGGGEVGKLTGAPYGEDVGTMLGALTGGAGGAKLAAKNYKGLNTAHDFLEGVSDDGVPELLRQVNARDSSTIGTLADVVPENLGLRGAQNFAERQWPATKRAADRIQLERNAQIVQQTADQIAPPGATPAGARAQAADRLAAGEEAAKHISVNRSREIARVLREETARADAPVARAEGKLYDADIQNMEARNRLNIAEDELRTDIAARTYGVPDPAVASEMVHQGVKSGKKAQHDIATDLYEQYRAAGKIDAREMKNVFKKFYDENLLNNEFIGSDLKKAYKTYLDRLEKLSSEVDPDQIQYLLSQTKAQLANGDYDVLSGKIKALNKSLEEVLKHPKTSPQYAAAVAASKDEFDRFSIYDAKADPETFLNSSGLSGQQGAVTARLIKSTKDPKTIAHAQDYFRSKFKKHVEDGGDPTKFLNQNSAFIDAFPELADLKKSTTRLTKSVEAAKGKAEDAKANQGLAKTRLAGEETKRRAKTSKLTRAADAQEAAAQAKREASEARLSRTVTGRYAQKGDVDKLVKDWLNKPSSVDDFKAINESFNARGQGDSFRADVRDKVIDQLMPTAAGVRRPTTRSIDQWVKVRPQLVDSGVLTEAAARQIDDVLARTKTERLRSTVRQAEGPEVSQTLGDLETSAAAAVTSSILPIEGHRLLLGNSIKRAFTRYGARPDPDPKVMAELHRIFTNPDELANFVKRHKTAKAIEDAIFRKMLAVEQATGENQEEQQ